MAGFGSGLAHALTQAVTGYGQGTDDRMKQIIALAAQKRAEERAAEATQLGRDKFQHEIDQDRRQNLINGLTEGETTVRQATTPDTGIPPINRTFDQALNDSLNNVSPSDSSLTRPPKLGSIPHYEVETTPDSFDPMAGKQGQLQAQRDAETAERQREAQEGRKEIASMQDATRKEIAGMRRDQQEPSWQTVTTADGSMVQVNPKTGATRPIGLKGKTAQQGTAGGNAGAPTVAQKNKIAEYDTTVGTIDEALAKLAKHPAAVGLEHGRGISDTIDQWTDAGGVDARAAMASVSSNLLHALSGAAISPSEYARLRQYVPTTRDRYQAAVTKLQRLRSELDRARNNMGAARQNVASTDGPRTSSLQSESEDAQLWDAAVAKHGEARVLKEYGPRPK